MSKNKSNKGKSLPKKNIQKKQDEEVIAPVSDDFVDASDDVSEDMDDLTSSFAKRRALAEDDSWDVVSTDEDDDGLVVKTLANDLTDEEQLDAVISDYAGIDGLAPEKSNKDD